MKASVVMKSRTGCQGTSDAELEAFRQYDTGSDNSLQASGGTILRLP